MKSFTIQQINEALQSMPMPGKLTFARAEYYKAGIRDFVKHLTSWGSAPVEKPKRAVKPRTPHGDVDKGAPNGWRTLKAGEIILPGDWRAFETGPRWEEGWNTRNEGLTVSPPQEGLYLRRVN